MNNHVKSLHREMKCIGKILLLINNGQNNGNCASFIVTQYLVFQLVSTDQVQAKAIGMFQIHIMKKIALTSTIANQTAQMHESLWLFNPLTLSCI